MESESGAIEERSAVEGACEAPAPDAGEGTPGEQPASDGPADGAARERASAGEESFSDQVLSCGDCRMDFAFSAREQAFFAERGFSVPKRCQPCRVARREQRQSREQERETPAVKSSERRRYDAICDECAIETTVPFDPANARGPVFCRDCHRDPRY
jgi:CxxC-x17-CxxC domain-containing protein